MNKPRAGNWHERRFLRDLLTTRLNELGPEEMEGHLRLLILAEHRAWPSHPHFDPTLPAYRFRARRIEVAKKFVSLGGVVSRCVLTGALPPPRRWPGIARLVKTENYALYEEPSWSLHAESVQR